MPFMTVCKLLTSTVRNLQQGRLRSSTRVDIMEENIAQKSEEQHRDTKIERKQAIGQVSPLENVCLDCISTTVPLMANTGTASPARVWGSTTPHTSATQSKHKHTAAQSTK